MGPMTMTSVTTMILDPALGRLIRQSVIMETRPTRTDSTPMRIPLSKMTDDLRLVRQPR